MGCAVETSKPKCRRKSLSTARPYGELSEEAKARAREVWRETAWDSVDSELLTEQFAEALEYEFGIEARTHPVKYATVTRYEPEIEWSLSYCQGDGVSFQADVDIEKIVAHGVPGCEYFSPMRRSWRSCGRRFNRWRPWQTLSCRYCPSRSSHNTGTPMT
jgi:hypothetical protein